MPYLGCIADDFTGGTDLASMLSVQGLRVIQMIGVPTAPPPDDVDAVVVALKSRTVEPALAVDESLRALAYLQRIGCQRFYFKYCSTFDSTDRGNIGPVTDALMTALDEAFTIACPAFPDNLRTVYNGYLFVGKLLLNESGMQNHPLTPMRDANLIRVLQRQTERKVGHVSLDEVRGGDRVIAAKIAALSEDGVQIAIVDAVDKNDLRILGAACRGLKLVTAGSGLAEGLALDLLAREVVGRNDAQLRDQNITGHRAIIAGSCSTATQSQVAAARGAGMPALAVDPLRLAAGEPVVEEAVRWAAENISRGPVLIYATADQAAVRAVQSALGVERAGELVEAALAAIAKGLIPLGVRQLIVAGGETSGAIVKALNITALRIGEAIAPGVPWTETVSDTPICLALKSGNFGKEDFFLAAWSRLPR